MPFGQSYQDELAAIRTYSVNQQRVGAYAKNLTPAQATSTAALARANAGTNPKVVAALGLNGVSPDDPLAQAVEVRSVNKKQGWMGRARGLVTAPLRAGLRAAKVVADPLTTGLKPGLRGAFMAVESPFQFVGGALRNVATGLPGQMGEIAAGAAAGAGAGAAIGGISGGGIFSGLTAPLGAAIGGIVGGIGGAMADEVEGTPQNPFMQTSAGQAAKQAWEGKGIDMGAGYFVNGKVREDLVKRQKEAASVNGHALTGGRLIADGYTEPGSTAYNLLSGVVDLALIAKYDPTLIAGKSVKMARLRNKSILPNEMHVDPTVKLLRKAGVMKTHAKVADTTLIDDFVSTPEIQNWARVVAGIDSAVDIRKASGGKITPEMAVKFKNAKTEQDVITELKTAVMQRGITEKKALQSGKGIMSTVHSYKNNSRMFAMMPRGSLDVIDMNPRNGKLARAVDDFDEAMKNMGLDDTVRKERLETAYAARDTKDFAKVVQDTVVHDYDNKLNALGWDRATRNKALGSYAKIKQDLQDVLQSELADDSRQFAHMIDGEIIPAAKGVTLTEALHHTIELPDVREARRLTAAGTLKMGGRELSLRKLYNHSAWRNSTAAMDAFTFGLWRPMTLLRPAWTMRMIGEEAIRMHVQGLRSDLFHPFSLIAKMVTGKGTIVDAIGGNGDVLASAAAHGKGMSSIQTLRPGQGAFSKFKDTFKATDEGFGMAHAENLLGLHQDDLARHIAENGVQDSVEYFRSAAAQSLREDTARVLNKPQILTPAGADQYVYELYARIKDVTVDDPKLIHAIATGKISKGGKMVPVDDSLDARKVFVPDVDDEAIPLFRSDGKGILHDDAVRKLGEMGMDPTVKSPLELAGAREIDPRHFKRSQQAMDYMFSLLMSRPTNYLSRSPAFNQFYWREMANTLPGMLPEARAAVLANAGKAQIDDTVRQALTRANERGVLNDASAKLGPDDLRLSIDEADEAAKAVALDGVKTVFDDLTKRGAISDAMRHVAPFGRAWREATGQWAKILVEDPTVIRQGQRAVEGLKGSYGGPEGKGFFYKDDNDKWVFNYPGSGIISKIATGIPAPMQAQASGLSMLASSMLPGTGPMVSLAASKIIPNAPGNEDLIQLLSPYGDPTAKGTLEGVLPPWFHKVRQALQDPEMDRLQGNTTAEVMRYLASTGEYDTGTPEGQQKLVDDAAQKAKNLTLLRAAAQFVSPSAPRPIPMAQDKDGRTVVAQILINDLHDMQTNPEIGYSGATKAFLDKYGMNASMYLQANTRAVSGQLPTTDKGGDFARKHPGLSKDFSQTYGFFAPQDGEFDYSTYLRAIQHGEREALSPSEQVKLANDKVGSWIYYKLKDSMGPKVSQEQRAALTQVKVLLMAKYPGFSTAKVGLIQRAEAPQMIAELERAVKDPRLADTGAGKALSQYLQLRDLAKAASQKRGLSENSFRSSNATKDLREVLRKAADILGSKNPGFQLMFDRVFDSELQNDVVEEA